MVNMSYIRMLVRRQPIIIVRLQCSIIVPLQCSITALMGIDIRGPA